MLKREEKEEIIKLVQLHEKDTGSPGVQYLLLTAKINSLEDHIKRHRKDKQTYRTLLKLYARRRKLRKYLMENYPEVYTKIREML
ncbi:MAG: 30S ribosomal protein S15 [Candidatus Calescibacterium sp.]|nr:30S ribosomal protein S15 [Candidatus Calescibacterium sp.]MCX7972203.1 30S ribosomal protein S15 [bacterium]MDW8194893.1 30S ribosomal protein S15 [Candidatus Calescibacterium sp.]